MWHAVRGTRGGTFSVPELWDRQRGPSELQTAAVGGRPNVGPSIVAAIPAVAAVAAIPAIPADELPGLWFLLHRRRRRRRTVSQLRGGRHHQTFGMTGLQRLMARLVLAGFLALAPEALPSHRFDLSLRPVIVLSIGEPTPGFARRRLPAAL